VTAQILRLPEDVPSSRAGSWGLVPTMGALHAGHLTLISRSAAENDVTVVSVFVNPSQFGDPSDLAKYPRDLDSDVVKAAAAGANFIYAPDVTTVYPPGFATWIEPGPLADRWEGESRPGHFRGVATVVSILLNTVRPDRSYFGEKDYQQLQVLRRVHRDLRLPGQVIASPTVRDVDGLALSSRNARLSDQARTSARKIPETLAAMVEAAQSGVLEASSLEAIGRRVIAHPDIRLDYLAVVDDETLEPASSESASRRILIAAEIDGVRLIDNVALPAVTSNRASHAAA
jgi:pantoate--beta-alanine ligase